MENDLYNGTYEDPGPEGQPEPGFRSWLYDWADALVSALLIIVLMFSFIMRVSTVDGESMLPTLNDRDMLLVSNIYSDLKQGDIIVASTMGFLEHPIVKRVIATEGQVVNINAALHQVSVNGKAIDDASFINAPTKELGDISYPFTVPAGCVFVMGDNRNGSTDSRDLRIGCVDERLIIGKALFLLIPGADTEHGERSDLSRIGRIR
jgi:signal peptidase I